MSNLIPPLLSSSPPPIVGPLDEDDDDEFGDFRVASDSYDCDGDFSLPPSPEKSPEKELKTDFSKTNLDVNSNKSQKITCRTEVPTQNLYGSIFCEEVDKDFQDRRKRLEDETDALKSCEIEVNCSNSQSSMPPSIFDVYENIDVTNVDSLKILDDQTEDKEINEPDVEISNDQNTKIHHCTDTVDESSDVVSDSINNHEKSQHEDINTVEICSVAIHNKDQEDFNTTCNEDKTLNAFSENKKEKPNNSDDLSEPNEINEIKSDNDSFEITEIGDEKEDNFQNSSKELNYDISESSVSLRVYETDPKLSDEEFGDFENHFSKEMCDPQEESEEEFDDFVNPLTTQANVNVQEDPDDFGDFESPEFGDFSSQGCEQPQFMDIDVKNAADKSEIILKQIFPINQEHCHEFVYIDETKGNLIFDELKDVTETNALIYQWSKSNSQKMFLKALNIDTRNILYGPAWNSCMPRFAANFGLTPLEPVKSEILTPTLIQNVSSPSNSSQKNSSDIPTAQFDWSGSGLINPLDSTSAELPGNVPDDTSQTQTVNNFLPTSSDKSEIVSSLFETESFEKASKEQLPPSKDNVEIPKTSNNQSDNFSPFNSPKLIPLRETHISNEVNDFNNKPGWLQPTIVTPDLPRKEPVVNPDDNDEFDDFQMVLPEANEKTGTEPKLTNNATSLPDLSKFDMTNTVPPVHKISHTQEHIFGIPPSNGPIDSSVQKQHDASEDDEFTDFHSSLPPTEILKPLQPFPLEPLKPSVQYSPVAQINWPDPGVTDEDIRNIELTYSRKPEPKLEKTSKPESKENSVDEDEWSDFVSVTNLIKSGMPERTATPDLPLSVLNLNNVQAPKQPVPVITPSGLIQTKLSSNLTLQPKSVVQTSVQPNMFRPQTTQFQPSTISSQFAANFFAGNSGTTAAPPMKSQVQDDEDWTDFVSSQPSHVNGYQPKASFGPVKGAQANWATATTNIIMNPTHFESFQKYAPPQNKKAAVVPTRNAIPSISAMPDLDFIAPKNRTSRK